MDVESLLKNLIEFETVNNPAENVIPKNEILHFIDEVILSPKGYKTHFYEKEGYWTLVSYIKRSKPVILFLGHCDVVPPGPDWSYEPFKFTRINDKAYGRGTADMKGAVAAMLSLADEFANETSATIIFALTMDEETGGEFGAGQLLSYLQKNNLLPDFVINGDGNGLQIINRRRNPFLINLKLPKEPCMMRGIVKSRIFKTNVAGGRTMHAAYFDREIDDHCAEIASKFLKSKQYLVQKISGSFVKNNVLPSEITVSFVIPTENADKHYYDKNLTAFVYSLEDFVNVSIPADYSDYGINLTFNYYRDEGEYHFCQLDLRIMSNNLSQLQQYFERFFRKHGVKCKISLLGAAGKVNTPINSPLIQTSIKVAKELKLSTTPIEMGGATDSRWFGLMNIPTLEFGPLGGNVHGANEYVLLSSLTTVQTFYRKLAKQLALIS